MDKDKQAQEAVEERAVTPQQVDQPTAGPHATEDLTDESKTPGTGLLTDENDEDISAPSS